MTTELGREVPLSDWLSFHRDRILSVLVQMRQQGGVPNPGLQASMIAGVTGLPEPQAQVLAKSLVAAQLLLDDGGVYRLTEQGLRWVLDSPT
jgi:DNA-binding IclR family transcriptional regulator